MEYPNKSTVCLTEQGRKQAKQTIFITSWDELLSTWTARLPGPQGHILTYVAARRGTAVPRREVAEKTGASFTSSGFGNNLAALRSRGLIENPDKNTILVTNVLFPEGLSS